MCGNDPAAKGKKPQWHWGYRENTHCLRGGKEALHNARLGIAPREPNLIAVRTENKNGGNSKEFSE